jgi:NAD(P)-dependent dehydrogenase (short-subunit alcohol dehydrogenase family)
MVRRRQFIGNQQAAERTTTTIAAKAMPLAEMSGHRMRRRFEVNIFGSYLCAREAARRISTSRGGSILRVSSVSARLGASFEFIDYAGSEAAVDRLALGLAKELGREGIRVKAVRPGLIDTEIQATSGQPDRAARLATTTPIGCPGSPVKSLKRSFGCRDAASYASGAILDVSGRP